MQPGCIAHNLFWSVVIILSKCLVQPYIYAAGHLAAAASVLFDTVEEFAKLLLIHSYSIRTPVQSSSQNYTVYFKVINQIVQTSF